MLLRATSALALVAVCAVTGRAQSAWSSFVAAPDSARLTGLIRHLDAQVRCSPLYRVPSDAEVPLMQAVARGNAWALRAALLVAPCLDGGLLGDFLKAGGEFFERAPRQFVEFAASAGLAMSLRDAAIASTPESTVDDFPAQAQVLRRRIEILDQLRDSTLFSARQLAQDRLTAREPRRPEVELALANGSW